MGTQRGEGGKPETAKKIGEFKVKLRSQPYRCIPQYTAPVRVRWSTIFMFSVAVLFRPCCTYVLLPALATDYRHLSCCCSAYWCTCWQWCCCGRWCCCRCCCSSRCCSCRSTGSTSSLLQGSTSILLYCILPNVLLNALMNLLLLLLLLSQRRWYSLPPSRLHAWATPPSRWH